MFCCQGFENLIGEAGQRGMAALVHCAADGFKFYLESRAVSKADEVRLSNSSEPWPLSTTLDEQSITLACSIGLTCCPFCGTKLQSLIRRSAREAFEQLAQEHMRILPPL
jgi:hypothetical protein